MSEDNIIYEYWTQGSRDDVEGLTTSVVQLDAEGNIIAAYGDPATQYKARKITKSEYDSLQNEMANATSLGLGGGLISPEIQKKNRDEATSNAKKRVEKLRGLLNRTASKVEKMIEAGIITFEPSQLSPPSSKSSSDGDIDFYLEVSDEFSARLSSLSIFTQQEVDEAVERFIEDYKQKHMGKKSKDEV